MSWTAKACGSGVDSNERSMAAGSGSSRPTPSSRSATRVGRVALGPAAHDPVGRAPEILDEEDAQRDRDRPELADREGLDALVGAHEAAEGVAIEVAVGVRDERPGQPEDARVSGERPVRELRQQAVEAGRQIVADLANLLVDEVEVVDQPLRGGRDRALFAHRCADRAVRGEQHAAVVAQPSREGTPSRAPTGHALRRRQALGMLLETLDAEELGADRRFAVPLRTRRQGPQGSPRRPLHALPSAR